MNLPRSRWYLILIGIGLVSLMGCTTVQVKNPQDSLLPRVQKLAQAKIRGDWATVYSLLAPSSKRRLPEAAFVNRKRGIQFKTFKIKDIHLAPSQKEAVVKVLWEISMGGYDFKNAPELQSWVYVDGTWYLKMKKPTNPFKN